MRQQSGFPSGISITSVQVGLLHLTQSQTLDYIQGTGSDYPPAILSHRFAGVVSTKRFLLWIVRGVSPKARNQLMMLRPLVKGTQLHNNNLKMRLLPS